MQKLALNHSSRIQKADYSYGHVKYLPRELFQLKLYLLSNPRLIKIQSELYEAVQNCKPGQCFSIFFYLLCFFSFFSFFLFVLHTIYSIQRTSWRNLSVNQVAHRDISQLFLLLQQHFLRLLCLQPFPLLDKSMEVRFVYAIYHP